MKKIPKLLCLALAFLFVLTACGGGATSEAAAPSAEEATDAPAAAAEPPAEGEAAPAAAGNDEGIPNFNATGYPICPDEKVTLTVLHSTNPDHPADLHDIPLVMQQEETMNVAIEYIQVINTGYQEKKNLMLATGDLPDIIESAVNTQDLTTYGPLGTFIPMQDLISKYATNYTGHYEEIPMLAAFTTAPDGNQYGLARINSGPWMTTNGVGIINQGWLDTLNLAMPTNINEFHDVLTAFKTQDPNGNGQADELPFVFALDELKSLSGNNGLSYLFGFFGMDLMDERNGTESYVTVRDGKVTSLATLPEMKEAISYLSMLYAEGLIDMESFTMEQTAYRAKLNNEPAIVGYSQVWDANDIISNTANNEAFVYMPMLKGPEGRDPVFWKNPLPGIIRGWGTITSACETPEVAMRWLDFFYEETNAIEAIEGPIGVRVLENPDGTLYVRTPPDGLSVAQDRFSNCQAGILGMPPSTYRNRLKLPSTDEKVAAVESFQDIYGNPTPMMPVYYSAEESTEMTQLDLDMITYIDRRISEWIMNGNVDAEWDAYLAEIEEVGQSRWLEIKQAAYDRFMASM